MGGGRSSSPYYSSVILSRTWQPTSRTANVGNHPWPGGSTTLEDFMYRSLIREVLLEGLGLARLAVPGLQAYVKCRLWGMCSEVLAHHFTYLSGPGNHNLPGKPSSSKQ